MTRYKSYFWNKDKWSMVTEDGLRVNVYPSRIVIAQPPYWSHKSYGRDLDPDFAKQTPTEFQEFVQDLFNFSKK